MTRTIPPTARWIPYTTTVPGTDGARRYRGHRLSALDRFPRLLLPAGQHGRPPFDLQGRRDDGQERHVPQLAVLRFLLVLSKTRGTTSLASTWAGGTSRTTIGPNSFYNISDNSTLAYDRPFNLRLMGTYRFPPGHISQRQFPGRLRDHLGPDGHRRPRRRLVRGQRGPGRTGLAVPRGVGQPPLSFLEQPGHEAGEGFRHQRQGQVRPVRGRLQPAGEQVQGDRPGRGRAVAGRELRHGLGRQGDKRFLRQGHRPAGDRGSSS